MWLCSEDSFRQFGICYKLKSDSVCMQMWGVSEREPHAVRGLFFFISIYKVSDINMGSDDWEAAGHVLHVTRLSGLCASTMCCCHVQVLSSSS